MRKSQLAKTILIVRLTSMGDVVIASPMAEILKRNNPNARIVWLAQAEGAEILRYSPHVDRIIVWDKDKWLDLWRRRKFGTLWNELTQLRRKLRAENFETAFDLQGLFKSGFLAWLSGAKERIGIGSREGSYWFMHKMVSRNIANRDQIGSEYRYLVNQMGYSDADWNVDIRCPEDKKNKVHTLLAKELGSESTYAVICPFASRKRKLWSDENWQQLALRIRGRYHLKTIVLGSRFEGTLGQGLARKCGAINLAGQTSLHEAAEIIKGASIVIGVDNGLTHIAQSIDTPSLALFGPSRPYAYADNENSRVLYLDRYCSPCPRKTSCGGTYDCMTEISTDLVLSELKQLVHSDYNVFAKESA